MGETDFASIFQDDSTATRMIIEEVCYIVGVTRDNHPTGLLGVVFGDFEAVE